MFIKTAKEIWKVAKSIEALFFVLVSYFRDKKVKLNLNFIVLNKLQKIQH